MNLIGNEEDMVTRLIARDEAALGELYSATIGKVYGLALKITTQAPLAEEVAEDTYWQVWQEICKYDASRCPLLPWMLMICRSRAIDALRKKNSLLEVAMAFEPAEEGYWEGAPEQVLLQRQRDQQLHKAIAGLTPVQQQMLHHAFYFGLTQQEIASVMQLPLGTVKSGIRRAQQLLKDTLERQNIDDEST
ncbi:MAG TPA: RNA polymerase sigma factor [Methylophilus sp.]